MSESIKQQVASLVKLQTVEAEIDDIQSKIAGVPERISALDEELKAFEDAMVAEGTLVDGLKKRYREQEREVQDNVAQLKKSQVKLNVVKNNKEYQSTLKEIEDLKALSSDIEDEMLENLDQVDAAEQSIAIRKEELASLSQHVESDRENLQQEAEECREKLAQLESVRDDAVRILEADLLDIFRMIRGKHVGGIAVVPVSDAVCNGCNVNLPPQLYNELQRSDTLRYCPNCQRIIYWKEAE